jgi:hypothetical protein
MRALTREEECKCGTVFPEGEECPWCSERECECCGEEFLPDQEYSEEEIGAMKEPPTQCRVCSVDDREEPLGEPKACIECGRDVPPESDDDLCEFCGAYPDEGVG